jgi:hypothetical protein
MSHSISSSSSYAKPSDHPEAVYPEAPRDPSAEKTNKTATKVLACLGTLALAAAAAVFATTFTAVVIPSAAFIAGGLAVTGLAAFALSAVIQLASKRASKRASAKEGAEGEDEGILQNPDGRSLTESQSDDDLNVSSISTAPPAPSATTTSD